MIPTRLIELMNLSIDAVTVAFDGLTDEQWSAPTDCPGWDVKDNLSHIVSTELFLLGRGSSAHQAPKFEYVKNPIGEMNENEIDFRRPLAGSTVYAEWVEVARDRKHQLATADESYFDTPWMMPTGQGTLGEFLAIRVLDLWVHEQDVRRALGRPSHEGGPAAEHRIDRLIRTIPIVVGKRAQTPEGGTVVIDITGPVTRRVVTTVVDGRAQIGVEGNVLCTVRMDSDTFLQLAGGRAGHTEATGWSAEGDTALAERVVANFNMMI